MKKDGKKRVVIENVKPQVDGGRFPIKRAVGEKVKVTADIFSDGHDAVTARILFKEINEGGWHSSPLSCMGNDLWSGEFTISHLGTYLYTVEGGVDHFMTWQKDLKKRY